MSVSLGVTSQFCMTFLIVRGYRGSSNLRARNQYFRIAGLILTAATNTRSPQNIPDVEHTHYDSVYHFVVKSFRLNKENVRGTFA